MISPLEIKLLQAPEMEKHVSVIISCSFLFFNLFLQLAVSSKVLKSLPGLEGPLPSELEAGYVGVGKSDEVQLFYYFFKSERSPKDDPLMIWLTGGPGCSGITGPVLETGPLYFKPIKYNGSLPTLETTPDSWTKVANIIFLDSPIGTGFSYSENPLAYNSNDFIQVEQIDQFLRKWLVDHPDFVSNPFYVGGDSYSGMTVPAIVQRILDGNNQGVKPTINIKGYVLGNPVTDRRFDGNSLIPFAHGLALISDELYESLRKNCREEYYSVDPNNTACLKDLKYFRECVSDVFPYHILRQGCEIPTITLNVKARFTDYRIRSLGESLSLPDPSCSAYPYWLCTFWANDERVREALDIRKGSIGKWSRCSFSLPYTYGINSSIPYHVNLSTKGLRSLVYSGDHDMAVPYVGTQAWIRSLNQSIVDDWRPWMINNQVAGYTRTYANSMTFATIKGGGHTAEYTRPECSAMFNRWITGQKL